MTRYTITFLGEKYAVARATFWTFAIPLVLAVLVMFCAYVYLGICTMTYYTGMPGWLVVAVNLLLFGTVTLTQGKTEQVYALTQGLVKEGLLAAELVMTICYVFQVRHWGALSATLFFLLPVMVSGRKIVRLLRAR